MVDCEQEYRRDFIEPPVASWQIGNGLEALGPSMNLQDALGQLKDRIAEEI